MRLKRPWSPDMVVPVADSNTLGLSVSQLQERGLTGPGRSGPTTTAMPPSPGLGPIGPSAVGPESVPGVPAAGPTLKSSPRIDAHPMLARIALQKSERPRPKLRFIRTRIPESEAVASCLHVAKK